MDTFPNHLAYDHDDPKADVYTELPLREANRGIVSNVLQIVNTGRSSHHLFSILPDSWPSFPLISFPTNGSYMVWPPWPQFADLPQEIRDRIVSHLRGCKDALRACALTHSSMTRAAQKELHHTINFNVGLYFYRRRDNEDKYSNSQVACHVRSISIKYLPLPSTNEVVWKVLRRLTRLEKVRIIYHDAFEWRPCTQSDKETLRKVFSSVKTIEIENGYHNRLKDFLSLLSGFQNMATLRLINLLYAEDDDDDDGDDEDGDGDGDAARCPDPLPGDGLRSLEIVHANRGTDHLTQNQYSELVQMWLIPLAKVVEPGLRFKWDDLGSDDVETFPRFMQALAPVLGSLEVSLSEGATAMGMSHSVVFSALSND